MAIHSTIFCLHREVWQATAHQIRSDQISCSVVSNSLRPHESQPPCPSPTPGVHPNSCPLSVMPSNHLILCHPLLLLPSIFPSIRVFSNESALCIRWPKDWSFSFNISPSNEHSGLIFFRMDWLDLLAVQDSQESSPAPQFSFRQSINIYEVHCGPASSGATSGCAQPQSRHIVGPQEISSNK